MNEEDRPEDEPQPDRYEVGYRKPPLHGRFRKGQSGNPKGGRPASVSEQTANILRRELFRKVAVREGEKVKRIPALEVLVRRIFADGAKGNVAALRLALDLVKYAEATKQNFGMEGRDVCDLTDEELASMIRAGQASTATIPDKFDEP